MTLFVSGTIIVYDQAVMLKHLVAFRKFCISCLNKVASEFLLNK